MEKLIQFGFQHGGGSSCLYLGGRQAADTVCVYVCVGGEQG